VHSDCTLYLLTEPLGIKCLCLCVCLCVWPKSDSRELRDGDNIYIYTYIIMYSRHILLTFAAKLKREEPLLHLRLLHLRLLHLRLTTPLHLRHYICVYVLVSEPRPQENLRLRLPTYYRRKDHARTTQEQPGGDHAVDCCPRAAPF
jgi:hypothetical protein